MIDGIVHFDSKSGTFYFDDVPVRSPADVPRRRAWRGRRFYATPGIGAKDWASILGPEDVVFGPAPGRVLGATIRIGPGMVYKILAGTSWGVDAGNPNVCFQQIQSLMVEAVACGLRVKSSVAATAMAVYLDRFDDTQTNPALRQLPARWRGLAHGALHGGPISVLRGGAPYATEIDVRGAYLAALQEPVPVLGMRNGHKYGHYYTYSDDKEWSKIRNLHGFVDATVFVEAQDPDGLPPLPLHLGCGTAFPNGRFRGCWTIPRLKAAEETGEVKIHEVHQFCFAAQTQPLFAELADFFQQLPRALGKRLYTRFWGKFATRGGYSGVMSEQTRPGEVPLGGFWWGFDGIDMLDFRSPPTYRPDLAAYIAAANHTKVHSAIRTLKPGSVVATHVDAVWTTDNVGAARLASQKGIGSWTIKRRGELRFYSTGCYNHSGKLGASGYDASIYGRLNPKRQRQWVENHNSTAQKALMVVRDWDTDPATNAQAKSKPLALYLVDTSFDTPTVGPNIYDKKWTSSGWYRETTQ